VRARTDPTRSTDSGCSRLRLRIRIRLRSCDENSTSLPGTETGTPTGSSRPAILLSPTTSAGYPPPPGRCRARSTAPRRSG
jgi:hypothetical protein